MRYIRRVRKTAENVRKTFFESREKHWKKRIHESPQNNPPGSIQGKEQQQARIPIQRNQKLHTFANNSEKKHSRLTFTPMIIDTTKPLCFIIDQEGEKHFKEITLEALKNARNDKSDIECHDIILTHYDVQKYGVCDTVDRFLYFAMPKQPKEIQMRFKTLINFMTKKQREEVSYQAISAWIQKQKEDISSNG